MAKKRRMFTKVRTDTFEIAIARYTALGEYDKADAIEYLARQCAIPIDQTEIDKEVKARRKFYTSLGD